jgi:DNA-binding LacI/PurR family transcriptional regulator
MIEATTQLLLNQIDGEVKSSSVVLPARLVVRGSTLRRNSLKGKR